MHKQHSDVRLNPGKQHAIQDQLLQGAIEAASLQSPRCSGLIAGVWSKLEPDLSRLVQGLPEACFRASNLPDVLKIDAPTGMIEGTPTGAGSCQVTILAFNCKGEIRVIVPFKIVAERAPSSLAYDALSVSRLIVGVEKKLAPETGFVAGVPAAKFEAISSATLSARALEEVLRLASDCRMTVSNRVSTPDTNNALT